jgi:transposase
MTSAGPFELESQLIGALPLVNHFLRRLHLEAWLEKHLPRPDRRTRLPAVQGLGLLLRNLVLARVPLYSLGEWTTERVPVLLGISSRQLRGINDDRVGRCLDRLFDADRSALLTDLVVHMVREFEVSLEEFHNDATTLSFHGEYLHAQGQRVRGRPTHVVTHGHNKDHRPDLKQLVWILTVSADGAVPVHFKVADGQTEDSTTHIETWEALQRLVGSARFLYVADSKLCTRGNLKHIHGQGGRFVTVLPRSRQEDRLFKDWLQTHLPEWQEVARRPHPRLAKGPPDVVRAFPSPVPDADGFRVVWYHSSQKMERDAQARSQAIQKAWKALEALQARLDAPRSRFRSRAAVAQAVEALLRQSDAGRWIEVEVTAAEEARFRQEKRGRAGKNTRWRRVLKTRFRLTWELRKEQVDYDARCDGIFPLITNVAEEDLSAADLLDIYKSKQPPLEKRHDLLKNVEAATPMYLKSIHRIEALLFLHFVALLIHALLERQIRCAMAMQRLKSLPLYPEDRSCKAPSARRILEIFENTQRHLLQQGGRVIQRFDPELTELQIQILELLGVPPEAFLNL